MPCFPACSDQNQGWDDGKFEPINSSLNYSQITGIDLNESPTGGNIDYSVTNDKGKRGEVRQIYPDVHCEHSVHFLGNGSIILIDQEQVYNYGQYCVAVNQRSLMDSKGRFMVQLCLEDKSKLKEKFQFYYIFMSLSVASLSITIFIYVVFKSALLR